MANKGLGKFLKEAQKMQSRINKIQEELALRKIEATSGGGMVKVEVNGMQELVSIKIEKEVVDPEDVEMLESLVQAAINEGMRKSRQMLQEEILKITGGLNIPGLTL